MKSLFFSLIAFSIACVSNVNAAEPVVLVEQQGNYVGYFEPPRLSQVVAQVNTRADLYWPSAQLFKMGADKLLEIEQQRKKVLSRLAALKLEFQQKEDVDLVASVETLEKDIAGWMLAYRMRLALDPDVVRAKKSLNPILSKGHYKLMVGNRPTHITLEGLVTQKNIPMVNATPVAGYIDSLSVMAGGSTSFVYVLPALEPYFVAKTGMWNKQYQEVSPGSILFIPFEQRHLPHAFHDINEQIVELLLHKVVAQ